MIPTHRPLREAVHPAYRNVLRAMFDAVVEAADPARLVTRHLPRRPRGRTLVLGAGKAAAVMARAVDQTWDAPLNGLAVTPYGHGVDCPRVDVIEASHPVPDQTGQRATARFLEEAQALGPDDLLLCLISGGASALLAAPALGITLMHKQQVTAALLRSGATIHEMNCVRKHLSAIKGGRLALRAAPARVVTLLISDVPGDDPSVVGSGPTFGDATTQGDALAILARYRIDPPPPVRAILEDPSRETPDDTHSAFAGATHRILVRPRDTLRAAAQVARSEGYRPLVLSDRIEGEAREIGTMHAAIARHVLEAGQPARPPLALISGGETTVTLPGNGGAGGRNTEFLLAAALALDGANVHGLACDTDGIDGQGRHAGAHIDPSTLARAAARGLRARHLLDVHHSGSFFESLGDLVVTGPTRTNVNDFRAFLVPDPVRNGPQRRRGTGVG